MVMFVKVQKEKKKDFYKFLTFLLQIGNRNVL